MLDSVLDISTLLNDALKQTLYTIKYIPLIANKKLIAYSWAGRYWARQPDTERILGRGRTVFRVSSRYREKPKRYAVLRASAEQCGKAWIQNMG